MDAIRTRIVDVEGVVSWDQLEDHGMEEESGRARVIRTLDRATPSRVRYLAAPLPEIVLRLWWWCPRGESNSQLCLLKREVPCR